jgi:DNA invertase Pin-like site-specific DNA recombinase
MADTKKAFAYLRVSGKGQVNGDGFPRQEKAIREYAKAHGIRIAGIYREEGVSGAKDMDNRPALSEMLVKLHSNGTKLILVERLDRLARDLMIQETIIGDLRKDGFELISVAEPDLCKDDPTRTLMRQIFGAIAEYDKAMIVSKLRGARQRKKALTGRCEGRKPYGHYSEEKATLERMRELRAEGLGFDRLAKKLNKEGLQTRMGTAWHGFTVNRILSRPTAK